jgi:diaminohydroxyphosphoribosylaminopyrimidine deaminase/5-amino-6-(5-phosphoribosylamino)uracil reductase
MTDRQAMDRALELARLGWGRVAPNPLVGAVLVRDGQVLAEGYHAEYGGPHAEAAALASGVDPRGATCVLTLEPCAHRGKTPPCADALIAAGVRRVVYALPDPDPRAVGGGDRLRAAGVQVEVGMCREEAAALNAPFLWARARPARPFVAVKVATSLDGFLADREGRSQWISGAEARDWVHWLRAGFDALAVGRKTAVIDDPQLTVRGPILPRVPPRRLVITRSGAVPATLRVVRTARDVPTEIFASERQANRLETALAGTGARVSVAEDLVAVLRSLRASGIEAVLVEGGAGLVASLLAADLVDRLYWIQAPLWLGEGRRAFDGPARRPLGGARRWTVTERRALGADTLLVLDRELCLPAL